MNKTKILTFGLLGILALTLATAAIIIYFDQVQQDIEVVSPIIVTSTPDTLDAWAGIESVEGGNDIDIENIAPFDIDVDVENDASEVEGIVVRYIGEVELTTKDLVTWVPTDGKKATIRYTVIGDTFIATGVPEGYTLVYYPNIGDYNTYTGYVVKVEGTTDSLPHSNDLNAGEDSNYCDENDFNPDSFRCTGAKLWLIPDDGFIDEDTIDWSYASEFLFDTELIQYNSNGLTIHEGETFTLIPEYTINADVGSYTITTTVSPTA